MTLDYAFNMLRRVRDELDSGRFAISHVLAEWNRNPKILADALRGGFTESELRRCAMNLEITYVLRLFSEFEATLRDYWAHGLKRSTEPGMLDLMESVASSRSVPGDDLTLAHQIREYRNDVIHESLRDARFDFPSCLRAFGRYLRWLPLTW
jgi:hypothetical protein